ncbi:hypothetical protein NECAME_18710, partial [Necator americanus]
SKAAVERQKFPCNPSKRLNRATEETARLHTALEGNCKIVENTGREVIATNSVPAAETNEGGDGFRQSSSQSPVFWRR